MEADIKELLWFQLNGSFNLLTELARDTTDTEWTSRAFPHANLVGFTVWHGARTIDWTVNCVLRGGDEVAYAEEWSDISSEAAMFGAGTPRESADGVAMRIPGSGCSSTSPRCASRSWRGCPGYRRRTSRAPST